MNFEGKHILLGVTGGIAAYKSANLLRSFQKLGAEVRVIMTPSALRFVGIETFQALSRHEVAVEIFSENPDSDWTKHIHWGEWADALVIAPCTANTMAKIAHGMADNMLTSTVLAARCPIVICPTMDGEMYEAPATQRNLKLLKESGFHLIEPDSGYLASGLVAKGRLPEDDVILAGVWKTISGLHQPQILAGKKVLITAGATREFFDPVRFISNPSTGKMGISMAKAAQLLGAEVTLIHAHISVDIPRGIKAIPVESAQDLFEAVKAQHSTTDIGIFTAAVSDYTPDHKNEHKIKKVESELLISLKKTPDSLAWFGENKRNGQISIGFAMETQDILEHAQAKRIKKNADYIIANSLTEKDAGFATDTNSVLMISEHEIKAFKGLKEEISSEILKTIFEGQP
ncbi:bifunctional phosphopantothenoylcysteine decarboxylase/phosphopantothenate--cysteine ligase CoaBC [bacterium]|nr:MAG: bifunctional phosphopantothenoylcysteine decarboxylase/phosphopantothenate--cysteine ligase CoaBC [bacterium]